MHAPRNGGFRPIVPADESLRFSAYYRMSASRFLLALATEPGSVVLPPA